MNGQSYSVSLFIARYDPMQYLQIATFTMAYIDEYRRTWIIVFDDVIWFGTSMDQSLINQTNICMAGISVSDDPFDENRKLGIVHEKVFILFDTDGKIVYFDSRVTTQREIAECTHIFMTGDTEWHHQSVGLVLVRNKGEE